MKTSLLTLFFAFIAQSIYAQSEFDGFVLYNAQNNNTTYLIDKDGEIAHTWNCDFACNYTVLLKNNGNIVRGAVNPGNQLGGAAEAGIVQEIDPDGNVVWEFTYSDNTHLSHHDLTLVNDNVLLTAWEVKSTSELTQAGYDGATSEKWPTHFVEVANDCSGGGKIVWEWHIWDHLIQDHDETKGNYGVVADHPELIDINMIQAGGGGGPGGSSGDWFHVNGVNYNAELDQIAFSSRHASEVYIIDHSTTSAEAAGHTGGNSGMGGDIIYRWGNPSNYGAPGSQQIPSAVHDVRWITDDGRPNGGYLQFFNNNGGGNNTSTVDAIETPLDGYNYTLEPGQAYGPSTFSWTHTCNGYASGQSASDRMSNGNVFVNLSGGQGGSGYMYEADSLGNIVWQYNAGGTQKAFRYENSYPGICALFELCEQGCTDHTACNYNSTVIQDDGSCIYAEMYYDCCNNCLNDIDTDGVCDEIEVEGCTDNTACNFDSLATDDVGCTYPEIYYDCNGFCINDIDLDEVCDEDDNCLEESNQNQEDTDNDGQGDVCDYDDGIGIDQIIHNTPVLIKMIDILGRERKEHNKGSLLFYIYNNGKVEKRVIY